MAKKEEQEQGLTVRETALPPELTGMFDLKQNMLDVEARLPQIGIIHQAQMFVFPDGEKHQQFIGTILDMNRINAWWEESFDESGGGSPPQCYSMNGVAPDKLSENLQAAECAECERNKYGSDGGRGKACKNMKRIHVLFKNELFPHRLTVPPSNLKVVDIYVTQLTSKGFPYQLVETGFSLRETKNKDGIKYSELVLAPVSYITDRAQAEKIKELLTQLKPAMRGQAISANEYEAGE